MGNRLLESDVSVLLANACISCIAQCITEADVQEVAELIIRHFDFQAYAFVVMIRGAMHEHYRYLIGCDPQLCYRYFRNKWYAIDPFIDYALRNTSPALVSEIPSQSAGQKRMRRDAEANGFRGGVVIPAHSSSSALIGVLYLGTNEGADHARLSFAAHRHLMRAFALELLEWWNTKLRAAGMAELGLDQLDLELLCKAREHITVIEAAADLGITRFCAKKRYERLYRKLQAPCKRYAVEKAIALGLIRPVS